MYFWNTQQLAEDIKGNRVGEKDKMYYYLITLVLWNLSIYMYLIEDIPSVNYTSDVIVMILSISVVIIGTLITFGTNNGSKGVDYIARVLMLSIPISVKLFVFFMIFSILAGMFGEIFAIHLADWFFNALGVMVEVFIYWRINTYLKYINQ